jgi:hypothetical protein
VAPALLGALLAQASGAADLGPGCAAGAGEADLVGDVGLDVAELVDELLEVVSAAKGATWVSHSGAAQESSSDSGHSRVPYSGSVTAGRSEPVQPHWQVTRQVATWSQGTTMSTWSESS